MVQRNRITSLHFRRIEGWALAGATMDVVVLVSVVICGWLGWRFGGGAGFAALYWLTRGHGYEITAIDVWGAYHSTLKAAERMGALTDTRKSIQQLVAQEAAGGLVRQVLGRELGLA